MGRTKRLSSERVGGEGGLGWMSLIVLGSSLGAQLVYVTAVMAVTTTSHGVDIIYIHIYCDHHSSRSSSSSSGGSATLVERRNLFFVVLAGAV